MSASVSLKNVLKMLDDCAPGYTVRLATHSRVVQYQGKTFRKLPKFGEIELGHLRSMIRQLGIKECAAKHGIR